MNFRSKTERAGWEDSASGWTQKFDEVDKVLFSKIINGSVTWLNFRSKSEWAG